MIKRKVGVEQVAATLAIIVSTFFILRYMLSNIALQKSDTFIYTVNVLKNDDKIVHLSVLCFTLFIAFSIFLICIFPQKETIKRITERIYHFYKEDIALTVNTVIILALSIVSLWAAFINNTERMDFAIFIVFFTTIVLILAWKQEHFTKLAIFNLFYIIVALVMIGYTNIAIKASPKKSYNMYYYGKDGNVTSTEINNNNYMIEGDKVKLKDLNIIIPIDNIILYEEKTAE